MNIKNEFIPYQIKPMTSAIILSAGQGKRLLPHTEHCPKCLLTVKDKTILEWQIEALLACGINEISIVSGFHADQVDGLLKKRFSDKEHIRTIHNPFFDVSDNLASCWLARHAMQDEFVLINGDTLFETDILNTVLSSVSSPVTLTIDYKDSYDEDDMKVELSANQVVHVSKALTVEQTHAESIGLLYFREQGPELFCAALEETMRHPRGLKSWFLAVIDAMASKQLVRACSIKGKRWAEIDFVDDLKSAAAVFDQ